MLLILSCRARRSSVLVSAPLPLPFPLPPPPPVVAGGGVVFTPSRLPPCLRTIVSVPLPVKICCWKTAVCGLSGPDTVSSPIAKITGIEAAVLAMGEVVRLSGREYVQINTLAPVLAGKPDLTGCTLKGTTVSATGEGLPFTMADRCETTAPVPDPDGQHTCLGVRGEACPGKKNVLI